MQEAVVENREVDKARSGHGGTLAVLFDMHEALERETEKIQQQIGDLNHGQSDEEDDRLIQLRTTHTALLSRTARIEKVQKTCREALNNLFKTQRESLQNVICTFEQMFIDSGILGEEEEDDGLMVVNEDPHKILKGYASVLGSAISWPNEQGTIDARRIRRTSGFGNLWDPESTKCSDSDSARLRLAAEQDLIEEYFSARRRLNVMEDTFVTRDQRFDWEVEERQHKLQAGEDVESQLAFDMRQLQDYRRMTQQVIESEQILEAAKAAALAAGVQIVASEISSGFVDDVHDGYALSSEKEYVESVDRSAIEVWMTKTSADATGENRVEVEVDDWDTRSVEISDSASMVAEGSNRRRIDRWKSECANQMQVW